MVGQISRQLVICPDVRYTFGRLRIQPIIDVIEIYKREMFNIKKGEIKRADVEHGTTKVGLRVSLPGNTCILKKPYQMRVCGELGLARLGIRQDRNLSPLRARGN
jgi:hypothetical protein